MNPATAYFIFNRFCPSSWSGSILYNPFTYCCAFCSNARVVWVTLSGKKKKYNGSSMYWKMPVCQVCRKQMRLAGSVFLWLSQMVHDDVRLLMARGYFEWAHFYIQYEPAPFALTDIYNPNAPFVWQSVVFIARPFHSREIRNREFLNEQNIP